MLTSGKHKKPFQTFTGILTIALLLLGFSTSLSAFAQTDTTTPTTINISDVPKMTNAQRLGVNLGTQNFWDSGMIMRNLAFINPGFEGESWQTILHCKTVTANTCTDDNIYTYWPVNFLAGGTASFIVGPAAGTTATVTSSSLPVPGSTATTITMSGLSVAPSVGDYVVVRLEVPGNAGAGWWLYGTGATYSSESNDLSPNTPGKQALVVNASGPGQQAILANFDDGTQTKNFIQLNGSYTISFRAKSIGGSTNLHINLKRAVTAPPAVNFLDRDVALTDQWQDYSFTYQLSETPRLGAISLTFTLTGGSMEIDDVAFTEAAGPNNPTAYRDAVVTALKELHPGTIRYMDTGLNWGSSIDNLLVPDFARERAGYSNTNTLQPSIAMGLHDFLVLCQTVGADPWFTMPAGMTTQEMSNLMDYFGGSTSTVYGAKRAALGQNAPWTTVFGQIHLEFGNEVWNTANPGATMTDPAAYGKRAGVIFTTAKASPAYAAKSFDFILDGFESNPWWTQQVLINSKNYDTIDVATYNFGTFSDTSSTENIFGSMFAEPEWLNSTSSGPTNLNAQAAASAGPTPAHLAVYETNMGTIVGTATQAQINSTVTSLGGGLAVASNMLLAQRDLGVTVQNMFALEGYNFSFQSTTPGAGSITTPIWGVVVDMGGPTNLKRPMYLSEQLANRAILPTLLTTSQSGSNPTWNQAYTVNDAFSLPNAHYIQSMAYTDGTTLNVILFNLSRTSALPVDFAGLNAPTGTATVSTLTAPSIDTTNETANNVTITSSSQSLTGGASLTLPPYSMTVVSVPAPVIPIIVKSVAATCARASLSPGDSTTCSAAVAGQGKFDNSVVWSAAAGSISSSGAYTAPATLPASGKDTITATSAGDATKSSSVTLSIAPNTVTGVTASCPAGTLNQGASINCTASVKGTGSYSNAYTWTAQAGSITPNGSFTAPETGSSVIVTATSTQDPTKSASVTLSLTPVLIMNTPIATASGNSVTLNWTTNMVAYGGASYGTSPALGAITPWVNYTGTTHTLTINGLNPSTKYYFNVFSFLGSQSVSQQIAVTTTNGAATVTGVTVSCSAASLLLGASTGCSATVQGSGSYSQSVTWATSLGSISATGVLTAPTSLTATSITVTATSVTDQTKSGSVTLVLTPPNAVTAVAVACQATTIVAGSTTTCSPTVTGTGDISKAVTFAASAGTITSGGVLTAPKSGSSVTVTATSVQDTTKSASAVITLTPLPTITSVSVACAASNLSPNGTTTCTPTVTGTGSYTSAVTWSASAGSITPTGGFTAPMSGSSVVITATSTQDPTKSGSVTLTLTPPIVMSGLTVSVTSTTATINWTTNQVVYGGVSYGTTPQLTSITPWVNYTGTTHSITLTGLTPSTFYYLSAFSFLGSQSVSLPSTFTTLAAEPTVTGVTVSCSQTLVAGSSSVCTSSVTGTGSYSSAVTWSATAGSINANGVLTAPTTGTSVTVKATSVADPTKSATTIVNVTPLPTISGVTVTCPASTLVAGSATACTASVTGTGSYTSTVTWSATGGSITPSGVLTTSTTATSVTVVATSMQDPTKSGSVNIALTQPVTVSSVKVYCPVSTLPFGKSVTCIPIVTGTGSPSTAVTWSASTGTITAGGVVTAPLSGSTITVTATSTQDPTKSGSVTMALVENLKILNASFVATPTTIVVSWDLPDYAYSGVSYNNGPGTATTTTPPATVASKHASFTFTGLTPGTTYSATIFSANKFASVSQEGSVTTPLQ